MSNFEPPTVELDQEATRVFYNLVLYCLLKAYPETHAEEVVSVSEKKIIRDGSIKVLTGVMFRNSEGIQLGTVRGTILDFMKKQLGF